MTVTRRRGSRARKLSISLPEGLAVYVEVKSSALGIPFSTALAEIIERAAQAEEQARLDAALALDAEDDLRFARTSAAVTVAGLERLDW